MPQPKKGARLGAGPDHQRLMLRSLARSLFEHERLQTTEAKAKMLRPFAERLITKAKKGSVHHRRLVLAELHDRDVVHKLFDDIGPRFADRNGGYTRVLKVGPRNGDGAPMALVELVEEGAAPTAAEETATRRRIRRPRRGRAATEAGEQQGAPTAPALEEEQGAPDSEEPAAEVEAEAGTAEATGDAEEDASNQG